MQEEITKIVCNIGSSDEERREKATQKLAKFLESDPLIDEIDGLKLWKGIFYHFWHCDTPKKQNALANLIANLIIEKTSPKLAGLMYLCYFQTLDREWNGLDRFRRDKFFHLFNIINKMYFNKLYFLYTKSFEDYLLMRKSWGSFSVNISSSKNSDKINDNSKTKCLNSSANSENLTVNNNENMEINNCENIENDDCLNKYTFLHLPDDLKIHFLEYGFEYIFGDKQKFESKFLYQFVIDFINIIFKLKPKMHYYTRCLVIKMIEKIDVEDLKNIQTYANDIFDIYREKNESVRRISKNFIPIIEMVDSRIGILETKKN